MGLTKRVLWGYKALVFLQVTLLHEESEEEESVSSHFFKVDALVENVTLLITGSLSECFLTSPSGESMAGSQRWTLMSPVDN